MKELQIRTYGMAVTTLEEVFMKIADDIDGDEGQPLDNFKPKENEEVADLKSELSKFR